MAIWRGVGGAGDATVDATNEAAAAVTAANNAATSASAAAASATSAATSATNSATSATSSSTSATSAASSATSATSSATTATTQATNASTSATAAASSASAASTSATAAAASQTAAASSETNAATSETNAATSETNAATSETNAASSATSAASSATAAASSASSASTSASNASTSETNAGTSETNAATSATNAASSATAAASSASAASTSASNASTSETNAATSESNASTSASNASTSETNAASSATAAASSATSAAASYDSFDDRYLGAKSSAPTLDNDGDALLTGALYYNTTAGQLYIWNGSAWDDAAFSASGAVTSFNTRTGAVTLSATDVNTALGSDAVLDSDIGSTVQAYSSVLQNTTASYTTAEETKLAGIETAADVTDATNVAAAGAVMESDTSTSLMSFVIDEDNMSSNSATKIPTQQSVKAYVDTLVSSGIHYHSPVRVESPTALTVTYNNGSSGVGATLTNAGTQAAISIDGVALSLNDRVLVYTQADATQNGVYTVTTVGDGVTNWVLTRATDADSFGTGDSDALGEGDAFFVSEGNTGAGELYVMNTAGTITFGTTNISFTQIAATAVYSGGTNVDISGTTIDLTSSITLSGTVTASGGNSTNWNTAYGWGNHASAGYLTSYTETDPVYTASSWYTTTNNSTNWDTAYGWGNHASAGYLTSEADTLNSVTGRGASTTNAITTGDITVTGAGTLRAPTGDLGSIEIDGNGKGGWEGYSIGGRANFMHNNASSYGLYDDVNSQWSITANMLGSTDICYAGSIKIATTSGGAAVTGDLTATGNVTAYYSDDRLKTNLGKIENALEKVESLEGFYYEANETAQALGYKATKEVGVSAQSVEKIMPEVVAPAPIDEQYLTVRYERLVPLLIEAVKELSAEVKRLKG
jgi:hypothetical protein